MLTLKYLLILAAAGALGTPAYLAWTHTPLGRRSTIRICTLAVTALLLSLSIQVVPAGMAGVRVSQLSGHDAVSWHPLGAALDPEH